MACQIWSDIGRNRSGQVNNVAGLFRDMVCQGRVCDLWVRDSVRQVWVGVSGLGQELDKPDLDQGVSMVKYRVSSLVMEGCVRSGSGT
jgi:hypothetical protein